jgi:hypothetical protein
MTSGRSRRRGPWRTASSTSSELHHGHARRGRPARHRVLQARGKLVDRLPGDKISRLPNARARPGIGQFSPVVFRILSLRAGLTSGITTCLAVEDVAFAH